MTAEQVGRRWRERRVAQSRRDVELETFPTTSGSQALLAHPMFGAGRGQSPQAPVVPERQDGETCSLRAGNVAISTTPTVVEFTSNVAEQAWARPLTLPTDEIPPTFPDSYYDIQVELVRGAYSGQVAVEVLRGTAVVWGPSQSPYWADPDVPVTAKGRLSADAADPFAIRLTGSGSGTLTAVHTTIELVDRAPAPPTVFALAISTVIAGSFDGGQTWTVIDDNYSTAAMIWTGDRFVAAGIDAILTSTDGTSWTLVDDPTFNPRIDGIATDLSGTVVIVNEEQAVYTSTDGGATFTRYNLPGAAGSDPLGGAAYGNGTFVVTSLLQDPARVWTSSDGVNWTEQSTSMEDLTTVVFGDGLFVAGGQGTAAWTSSDGVSWSQHTVWSQSVTVQGSAHGNGRFLLLGPQGLIAWSDNGTSWSEGTTVGAMNTYAAVFDGSVWWAVGGEPFTQVIRSLDNGETWEIVVASGDLSDFGGVGYSIALPG